MTAAARINKSLSSHDDLIQIVTGHVAKDFRRRAELLQDLTQQDIDAAIATAETKLKSLVSEIADQTDLAERKLRKNKRAFASIELSQAMYDVLNKRRSK